MRGLIPLAPTAEELAQRTKEFSRFRSRPHMEPEAALGIFDDVVAPFREAATPTDHETESNSAPLPFPDKGDIIE